jgi:hypothetical protein
MTAGIRQLTKLTLPLQYLQYNYSAIIMLI